MPIYEYQCSACNKKLEILQKISDPVLTQCPSCKEDKLRKMVTAAAFRLKGGGWYESDFKDKKSQKNMADSGESTSKPASSDSGNSESKTASTATSAAESKPTPAAKTSTD